MYARRVGLFILISKDNKVLLQFRDNKALHLPEYWAFFGGGIKNGEMPEEAARREAREELGIELADLNFFKRYEFQQENGLWEEFVFTAPLTTPIEKLKRAQKEGQSLGLFAAQELKNLKIADYDRIILNDLFINRLS